MLDTSLVQQRGPALPSELLVDVARELVPAGGAQRRWGVAFACVGPFVDLVADGSALRVHALQRGALVRTTEVLATTPRTARTACLPLLLRTSDWLGRPSR